MSTLEVARRIAEQAHLLQKRKNGEAYIHHCIRVSKEASEYSSDAAIVGMLHDVLEDSDEFTIFDLKKAGFNESIISSLCLLWHLNDESYLSYILTINSGNELAKYVKLCDIKDNLNGATGTLKDKYQLAYYILTGENIS